MTTEQIETKKFTYMISCDNDNCLFEDAYFTEKERTTFRKVDYDHRKHTLVDDYMHLHSVSTGHNMSGSMIDDHTNCAGCIICEETN